VTRVLIVDDSPLMRRLLGEVFAEAGGFDLAFARDGAEALEILETFAADVVTLDVEMPRMDGLTCLDRIMVAHPRPVVMLSGLTRAGADITLEALSLGAVDFVPKPDGPISMQMDRLAPLLLDKVRGAAGARLPRSRRLVERLRLRTRASGAPLPVRARARRTGKPAAAAATPAQAACGFDRAVVIGCSTGGPPALDAVLARLPADFPWPVLVAQHMPASFTGALARRLDKLCALSVQEVTGPTALMPGHVYIARGDADMIVSGRASGPIALPVPALADLPWHPSVDRLMDSALEHLGASRLIGVLMTGMGYDGAASMTRLHEAGGPTFAEAEATAVVWGMPGELVRAGGAGAVVPLDEIAGRLVDLEAGR
jgi:two-component system chemotaxis response regulator CheB